MGEVIGRNAFQLQSLTPLALLYFPAAHGPLGRRDPNGDTHTQLHQLEPASGTAGILEPISKSFKKDRDRCELNKTKEVGRVVLPSDQESSVPLEPRPETLDQPAAL
jgi:hypothetical protein